VAQAVEPGGLRMVAGNFGLAASAVVELAIIAVGSYLYWRAAVRTARVGAGSRVG
jgi:hypothetical protein